MPTYGTTPRYALRKLLGSNVVADIDAGFDALATDVDNDFTGYKSGTHSARLAATSIDGLLWRETDTGLLYLGIGSGTWTPVMFPGAWVSLTLGTNVTANSGSPAVRIVGDRAELRGTLGASGTVSAGGTIFTVAAAAQPATTRFIAAQLFLNTSPTVCYPLQMPTSGACHLSGTVDGPISTGQLLILDGLSYPLG